eukprot:81589-Prymnesium_polylepis.1
MAKVASATLDKDHLETDDLGCIILRGVIDRSRTRYVHGTHVYAGLGWYRILYANAGRRRRLGLRHSLSNE